MADAIYEEWKEDAMDGTGPNLSARDILAIAIDSADYTRSTGSGGHSTLSDVPAGARVATSSAIGGKSIAGRTFDLADYTWTSVSGDPFEEILYVEVRSAGDATTHLVIIKDTATGLPATPGGSDINVTINASGLFGL